MTWSTLARGLALLGMGLLVGLAVCVFVYVPAGRPDAAEVTLLLVMLTIGVAGLVGWALRAARFAGAGNLLLGVAIGAIIAFVLIFTTPLAEAT